MSTLLSRRSDRSSRTIGKVLMSITVTLAGSTAFTPSTAAQVGAAPRTCSSGASTHEVVRGDTWFDIAADADASMRALLEANGADLDDPILPGDELCLPAGATPTTSGGGSACTDAVARYSVETGDSWFRIAQQVSVGIADLLDANGATASTTLQPGQRLCLPAGATVAVNVNSVVQLDARPMQGPCWYGNTWQAARGNGRRHEGVDLIAASGNFVYAVTDGTLTRRAWDQPGGLSGNAWWLTAADGTYYFYAHLSDFAPGLKVGSRVRAGEIIGFNGTTGSSATPHLHFEIHPAGGAAINPYPTMRANGACRSGAGYEQPGGWVPEG